MAGAGRPLSVRPPVVEENILDVVGRDPIQAPEEILHGWEHHTVYRIYVSNNCVHTTYNGFRHLYQLTQMADLSSCQWLLRQCVEDSAILLILQVTDVCSNWHTWAKYKSTYGKTWTQSDVWARIREDYPTGPCVLPAKLTVVTSWRCVAYLP
jgi:hypothetical protein